MLFRPLDVDTWFGCFLLSSRAILEPPTDNVVVNNLERVFVRFNREGVPIVLA